MPSSATLQTSSSPQIHNLPLAYFHSATLAPFYSALVNFAWFKPAEDYQWFRWHTYDGILEQKTPNTPQSWSGLLEASENGPIEVPALLRDRPEFAVLFSLVFPHRFGVGLMRLIDRSLQRV